MLSCGRVNSWYTWTKWHAWNDQLDLEHGTRDVRDCGPLQGITHFSSFYNNASAVMSKRVINYTSICREWSNYIYLSDRIVLY